MKLFVSRKKYDLLNKEYLLFNDNYEELKNAYKEKCDRILDLKYKNEMQYFEKIDLENQISILNQEVELYDKTVKDLEEENEKLKKAYEEKYDRVLDLEYKSEMSYFERVDLENEILSLKEENEKLKKANEELAKLWNDANRKLWCNNESARQLRKLSEDILASQRIDKSYLSSYIHDISLHVGGGIGVELKSKDK